jgi:acetoin utilization protein AcuA
MNVSSDSVEILIDPLPEVIERSAVAAGMGVLYRYHPDSTQRLAEGFPRFAQTTDGRLVLARAMDHRIVGYALIARPDPRERWADPSAPEVWELGMIEVARGWRRRGIGRQLLRACLADGRYEDRIVLATAYSWHWDLHGTHLAKAEYRAVLLRLFGSEGFRQFATNEPNVQEDPANHLLVRIGPRVRPEARARFLNLLQTDPARATALAKSLSASWKTLFDSLAKTLQLWSPTWWLAPWSDAIVPRTSRPSNGCGHTFDC